MCVDRRYLYFVLDRKNTKYWRNSYVSERKSVQKMLRFVMNGCWKRKKIERKLFYLSLTGNSIMQWDIRGVSILPLTKISIWNTKTQIKNPSKTNSCGSFYLKNWLISSETLVYMLIEPYLSNSLYTSFLIMVCAIRSLMQWRPSNRKLSVSPTGNEINKAYSNNNIAWFTREFVLFVIHLNLGQQFSDYREMAFIYSGNSLYKLRVAEVDYAGGRSLKMLEWMKFIALRLFVHFRLSSSPASSGKLSAMFCCYFLFWPLRTWIDPITRLGNFTDHPGCSYQPWNIYDYI